MLLWAQQKNLLFLCSIHPPFKRQRVEFFPSVKGHNGSVNMQMSLDGPAPVSSCSSEVPPNVSRSFKRQICFFVFQFFFPLLQTEGNKLSFSKGHTLLLKLPAGRTCTFCSVRLSMKEGSQTSSIPSNNRVAHQPPSLLPLIFISFDESIKRIRDPK